MPFFETGSSACSVDGKRGDTKGPLGTDQDDRCRLHDRALGLDAVERAVEVEAAGVEIGRNQHRRPADAGVAVGQDGASAEQRAANPIDSRVELLDIPVVAVELVHLDDAGDAPDGIVSGSVVQLQMWVMLCGLPDLRSSASLKPPRKRRSRTLVSGKVLR